jgi:uncharacterized protein (TIGR02246 family)
MVRYVRATLAIACVLALGACAQAPQTNAAGDISAVNAVRNGFISAMNAGDAAAIGDLYAADGVSNRNHDKTITGRDAIVESQKAMFSQFGVTLEIMPDETRTIGDFGFDRGRYKMTMTPKAGGDAVTDEGRYIVLLQKQADGAWKVTSDMDNSTVPMPPVPVVAEKK